jgi:acetyltransferase-like isoleucine patch superfamily enzyme
MSEHAEGSAFELARTTPWRAWNEIWRYLALPVVWFKFRLNAIPWAGDWHIYGVPIIQKHAQAHIRIGPGLWLRSAVRSNPLAPAHPVVLSARRAGSRLIIGRDFAMTGGVLCAEESIEIGDGVTVGANCTIADADFHALRGAAHLTRGTTAPVVIEDDVFIGMWTLVLKGLRIGRGSVIGAGSVVTSDVPPGVIAAGNPARVVRESGAGGGKDMSYR